MSRSIQIAAVMGLLPWYWLLHKLAPHVAGGERRMRLNRVANLRVARLLERRLTQHGLAYTWLYALQSGCSITLDLAQDNPFEKVPLLKAARRLATRSLILDQDSDEEDIVIDPTEVCIASFYTSEIEDLCRPIEMLNRRYAAENGYSFSCSHEALDHTRHVTWSKILHVRRLLDDFKYVVWIDADALFVDVGISLTNILRHLKYRDILISLESPSLGGLINTGFFAVKGEAGKRILDVVYSLSDSRVGNQRMGDTDEQDGFYLWLYENPRPEIVGLISSDRCNAHPNDLERPSQTWGMGGPFVVHPAGCSRAEKLAFLQKYLEHTHGQSCKPSH